MATAKKKFKFLETPVGKALWVKTKTADTYGNLVASVILNAADALAFSNLLDATNSDYYNELSKDSKKKLKNKDNSGVSKPDEKGAGTVFTFKIKEKITFEKSGKTWTNSVKFYDAKGDELDEIPYVVNDSDIKLIIKANESGTPTYGYGAKFELAGVQVVNLKESAYGWKPSATGGAYTMDGDVATNNTTQTSNTPTLAHDDLDDPIPF